MNSIIIEKKPHNEGDGDFSRLVDECKENLYRIAFAHLKNEQNSLDAISDTIYEAYMNISELKMPECFNTWIIRILIKSCNDISKNNKVIYIDEYNKINESRSEIIESEFEIANNIDLYNSIGKLSERLRIVVILKYLEGMNIAQISEFLELPKGTIKFYLRRALEVLKINLA